MNHIGYRLLVIICWSYLIGDVQFAPNPVSLPQTNQKMEKLGKWRGSREVRNVIKNLTGNRWNDLGTSRSVKIGVQTRFSILLFSFVSSPSLPLRSRVP